jgi:hypothetical protein
VKKFKSYLSTRSQNGILRCLGRDVLDKPEKIVEAGPARLKRTVQIGPKSIKGIALALFEFGYIDNPEMWLE